MSAVTTFGSLVSIALLWVGIVVLWPRYRIDKFRQDMFELRDDLFDDAMAGRLSFDDSMYGVVRKTMNGFIRFAHAIDLLSFSLFVHFKKQNDDHYHQFRNKMVSSLNDLPEEKQKQYRAYLEKMNVLLVKHLVLGSPVLAATVLVPIILYFVLNLFLGKLLDVLKSPLARADSLAYAGGASN